MQDMQDRELVYGIRPEHFSLVETGGVEAEVVVVEPMGSETQVTLRLANQNVFGIFRERVQAQPGQFLRVAIDTACVHLFDADTGERVQALPAPAMFSSIG